MFSSNRKFLFTVRMEYREDDKIQLHVYRVEIRRFTVIIKTIVCVLRLTAVQYLDNLFTFLLFLQIRNVVFLTAQKSNILF